MSPYQDAAEKKIICPHCKNEVPLTKQCPVCGQILPKPKREWKMPELTPVEIFLAVLGSILLFVALVAV